MAEIYGVVERAGGWARFEYADPPDWLGRLLGDPGVLIVHAVSAINPPEFDDAALEHLIRVLNLEGLTDVRWLHLDGTQVTDAGLEHLKGLTNLKTLVLVDTQITDAGLEHLKRLTSLDRLYLWGTRITDEGVRKLQEALPNCYILPSIA